MHQKLTPAAVFIDFENIYFHLREKGVADPTDLIVDLIKALRKLLSSSFSEQAISLDAFADFERLTGEPQGDLYLLGVEAHNVLGTNHKNAADMKMCIGAMEMLYTRPNIETFVFLAGDRDYIPVIQHLKKHGKTVRVAGYPGSVSGDLLTSLGEEFFIDASRLVPVIAPAVKPQEPARTGVRPLAPGHQPGLETLSADARRALRIIIENYGRKPEIWLKPCLFKLRDTMSDLVESERKQIIAELESAKAISIDYKDGQTPAGEPIRYAVIMMNWNHDEVRAANA